MGFSQFTENRNIETLENYKDALHVGRETAEMANDTPTLVKQ